MAIRAEQHRAVTLGIPGLVLGLGVALIPLNFWVGVAVSTGAVLFLLYLCYRLFSKGEYLKRWACIIATVIGYGIIGWLIWVPAKISILMLSDPGGYSDGTDIVGIKWQSGYSEFSLSILNSGGKVNDVDFYFRTNLIIGAIGIISGINSCTKEPWSPFDIAIAKVTYLDPAEKGRSIPLFEAEKIKPSIYHIHCPEIGKQSSVVVKFAIMDDPLERHNTNMPQWAKVWMSLFVGYRPATITEQKCFAKECSLIPADMHDIPPPIHFYSRFVYGE